VSEDVPGLAERERQLRAAVARHGEAVASLGQRGRSATSDSTAAGAEERGAALVIYALRGAHAAGVAVERIAEITGLAPDEVRDALQD
jgi:hypothetical protein